MKTIPLALALLAGVAGCDAWLTKPSLYNTVEVISTRRNGDPIPGTGFELYTGPRPMGYGVTGADGRFTFTRVPQGLYGVIVTTLPSGYEFMERVVGGAPTNIVSPLDVSADTLHPVHFTFLKRGPGTIVARVIDGQGVPMAGITVEIYDPTGKIAKSTTDANGSVVFNAVPFGQYGVVVTRPVFFKDYRVPGDSAYSYRDGLLIEDGVRDSVAIPLAKCAGTVRVHVQDQTGAPVRLATATVYAPTGEGLATAQTGADGRVDLVGPCAYSMGVHLNPPLGYTAADGRGTSFLDGILFTKNGDSYDAQFVIQRLP